VVIYVAYNTKLYKSTGSGWDEVRVASEWGLIANKPSTFTPTAHSHAAEDVTQGTFNVARIPNLSASKITSGVFSVDRIPNLSASKITSGVFSVDRIPDLDASKITSGTFATARIPNLSASKITSGVFSVDRIPNLSASKITSGVFSVDRIPDLDAKYVKTSGNQTITGIKQIDNSDLRMNGGSVSYLRPVTTGGWARGFWWQKNATDDVPYQRIGGIGVLGNNLSVSKFYIGYGESPWTNSILEAFPDYVNINGTLRTIATTDASSDTTVTTKAYVLGKCLGKTETAANSAKLGGQLPSYYASKSDVPVITYSNGTLTITTG
jgi:hypothetical protein